MWNARRILLISANRCTVPEQVFPLGLTHLHAALRQAGHTCAWLDLLAPEKPLEKVLADFRPDFVAISVRNIDDVVIRKQETYYDEVFSLCGAIRQQVSCPIIIGGSGFSIFPKQLLARSGADYGIAGEGEKGLIALIACLEKGEPYDRIPGLVFRQDNEIVANPPDMGSLDWDVAEADRPAHTRAHYLGTSGVLNLQTQRGCGFHCCYCTYPVIEGRRLRRRPAALVADEFRQLARLGANYVFIVDSVFNSSAQHVSAVCEAILSSGAKISWGCFLRPQGLTPELMKLMVKAGLAHIEFGSDSFCDEVLQAYDKQFSFEDICYSAELARSEHLDCCHFLIAGGPGETMETLNRSFENSRRLQNPVVMAVAGMRIYPETPLYRRALAEGIIQPETDLLTPRYYVAPGLDSDTVFNQLKQFARQSPNWVVGDPIPTYLELVERLRRRGVVGPLWSYLSTIQRLWPHGVRGD